MMESERSRISYRLSRISNVVYFIGLIVFFALPYFNHRISTSEHGLTVGNLNSDFNSMKMKAALRMMDDYHCDNTTALSLPLDWIRQRMESDGMKTHIHTFTRSGRHLVGHNIVGKIQAKKSVGIDSIVISFPYVSSGEGNITECASSINRVAVAVSLMDHLKDVNWLHKDIIFLGYDGRWEYNEAVDAWLESIFTPGSDYSVDSITSSSIIASISLEFTSLDTNRLALLALGINGQLPDMDLVATLVYFSQVNLLPYKRIYDIFSLLPDKIGGMLTFMINQASGVPKGSHAYFMKYNIPGVTIADVQESVSSVHHNNAMELIVSLGRTLELAIHSLNNLIEPLHASFLFYLLPDLRSVVPSSEYSIAMAFFVAYGAIKATSILILERVNFQYVLWSTLCIVTATLGSMIPHLAWLLPLDLEPWMIISGWSSYCTFFSIGYNRLFVPFLSRTILGEDTPLPKPTLRAVALLWATILGVCSTIANWSFGLFVLVLYVPICALFRGRTEGIGRLVERIVHLMLIPDLLLLYLGLACKRYPSDVFFLLVNQWVRFHTFLLPMVVVLHTPLFIVFSIHLYQANGNSSKEKQD